MHEFVVSASQLKKKTGASAGDVAKAILDSGMHSPTTYFPLIVPEALMVEPTETESVENLEAYASTLNKISKLASDNPSAVKDSPKNTSVGRLDEYKASHPSSMILNWNEILKENMKAD
jgi:glycine dehydrogenase subunit 2